VKAKENNELGVPTLLHYLVYWLENYNDSLLEFMEEMPHVEAAARGREWRERQVKCIS
jgi:hypothetical protein